MLFKQNHCFWKAPQECTRPMCRQGRVPNVFFGTVEIKKKKILLRGARVHVLCFQLIPPLFFSSFVQFQVWDFPGQLDYFDSAFDSEKIFGECGAVIFVLDSQDEYTEAMQKLHATLRHVHKVNPKVVLEVFIHKVDGLSDDQRIETQRDIQVYRIPQYGFRNQLTCLSISKKSWMRFKMTASGLVKAGQAGAQGCSYSHGSSQNRSERRKFRPRSAAVRRYGEHRRE